jgi:hypothetical protein
MVNKKTASKIITCGFKLKQQREYIICSQSDLDVPYVQEEYLCLPHDLDPARSSQLDKRQHTAAHHESQRIQYIYPEQYRKIHQNRSLLPLTELHLHLHMFDLQDSILPLLRKLLY